MNPSDILALISAIHFNKGLWDPFRFLTTPDGFFGFTGWAGGLKTVTLSLSTLCLAAEITRRAKSRLEGEKLVSLPHLVGSVLLLSLIAVSGFYEYAFRLVVSIGAFIQNTLMGTLIDYLEADLAGLYKNLAGQSRGMFGWLTAYMELFTPLRLLSAIAVWTALSLLYIIPLLQALYLAILFLLGPLLLPFGFFTPMRGVALFWIWQVLGAVFIGIIAVVSYSAISASGVINNLSTSSENHVLTLYYSLVTIGVLVLVPSIAFGLFGAFKMSVGYGMKKSTKFLMMGFG